MNSNTRFNVAVVGATGAVGETMLRILEERDFPIEKLFALASERSAGSTIMFRGKAVRVQDLATFDFSQVQIALFSAGGAFRPSLRPKPSPLDAW